MGLGRIRGTMLAMSEDRRLRGPVPTSEQRFVRRFAGVILKYRSKELMTLSPPMRRASEIMREADLMTVEIASLEKQIAALKAKADALEEKREPLRKVAYAELNLVSHKEAEEEAKNIVAKFIEDFDGTPQERGVLRANAESLVLFVGNVLSNARMSLVSKGEEEARARVLKEAESLLRGDPPSTVLMMTRKYPPKDML